MVEPYKLKTGTREKGQAWDKIAANLNCLKGVRFVVDQRGLRERYAKLERNFKRKMAAEERASGIVPEMTELDEVVESIIERSEGAQEEIEKMTENKRKAIDKEKESAESVRKRSVETLAETRERENQESARKKKRSDGNGTIEFLRDKSEKEMEVRTEELAMKKKEHEFNMKNVEEQRELKKRELELREREQQAREKRGELMMQILLQQQQQQQAVMMQMQQISQALVDLIKSLKENKQ